MKNSLILLVGAATLSLASCSSDNGTATTTAADGSATTTTTTTTTTGAESAAVIEARAQRIADKMVADMKITDEATKTKIRTVYVNRARRMGEMRTKYTADTTGMAAAMRTATSETDTEFKAVFTDPAQYQAYESSRSTYDDSNFMEDASASADGNMSAGATDNSKMSAGAEGADVTKVKVKADGDVKIKDADGNKTKIDGDDGTMKVKPNNGEKTKIE